MEKKKPESSKNYFGPDVEQAIQDYNTESNEFRKQLIFTKKIYPALNKLVENVIHVNKFYTYETTYADFKSDIVAFLYERLYMISSTKGKAYSYFTRCVYHYCLKKSMDLHKEKLKAADVKDVDNERNVQAEIHLSSYRESLKEFIQYWSEYCIENLDTLFKSKNDKKVAEAIVVLFQNAEDVDLYNKKELYVLIREHSKLDTQYITRVAQQLKTLFYQMFRDYQNGKITI